MKYSATWFPLLFLGCGGPAPLTVDMPLHLEDHLDAATIVGSQVPNDIPEPVEWRFGEPQPDWRSAKPRRDAVTSRSRIGHPLLWKKLTARFG